MSEETALADTGLGTSAVGLLCELIALDTVNPPGNEDRAQDLLSARLRDAGFEITRLAAEPGRDNLIADLAGNGDGPTLCLLGHVDTVPANADEWSFSPWAGDVAHSEVRGRGAQDMKGQVACEVAAAISLAESGWRPARGALKLVLTADEEMGAALGAQWLCAEHPEAVRSDLVVNEGGGHAFELGGRRFYTLCVGEKGVNRFHLRARGKAGHGSVPALGDNALLKLAPAVAKFADQAPIEPTPAGAAFLGALLDDDLTDAGPGELESALERLRSVSPQLASYIAEPMLRVTFVPTRATASNKDNVIPSSAEVLVDCRVPPGGGTEEVEKRLAELLGPLRAGLEVEFAETVTGNSSPPGTPFADTIAASLAAVDPEAALVPIVMAGFSDSHWFRKAFDSATVYGFCPQRAMGLFDAQPLIHSADERAAVSDIEMAATFYADLCRRVLDEQ
jgi:acetylornithine deacetylase/succinyl-diaminopimelate desuccinylase-like protein